MSYLAERIDDGLPADDVVVEQHLELLLRLLDQEEPDGLGDAVVEGAHHDPEVGVQTVADLLDEQLVGVGSCAFLSQQAGTASRSFRAER